NNYGVSINRADGNRKVTWSARRANGKQTLYYRLVLTKRYTGEKTKEKGPIFRDSLPWKEKIAAEALLAPIRQHSADVETFVSEAIKRANNGNDDNVKLLMAGDTSLEKRVSSKPCCPSLTCRWSGSIPSAWSPTCNRARNCGCAANGENWLYFNVVTGEQGLPSDRLIWWLGDEPLMTIDGGKKAQVASA
ncbi:UUP1 family membrane protein, partial [Pseudomonas aeruginosa]